VFMIVVDFFFQRRAVVVDQKQELKMVI